MVDWFEIGRIGGADEAIFYCVEGEIWDFVEREREDIARREKIEEENL